MDMRTGTPLSGAGVVLHLNTIENLAATAPTDAQGHFFFDNLPPGTYTLRASHPGFDARWFGACTDEDEGVALSLRPGENRTDVKLLLPPLGVITGTITGAAGEPMVGAFIDARPDDLLPGHRVSRHTAIKQARTDEGGHFRLFGLRAGTYLVSAFTNDDAPATAAVPDGQSHPEMKYRAEYYPGTPSRAEATPVHLSMGEVRENVDFQLHMVHAVKVEATVQPPPGIEGPLGFQAELTSAFEAAFFGFSFDTPGSKEGAVEFRDVYPGKYYLKISATVKEGTFGSYDLIDIPDEEGVRKVTVQLSPAVEVHGVVKVDRPSAMDLKSLRVSLKDGRGEKTVSAAIPGNGVFAISRVSSGHYSVEIGPIPEGAYLKSILCGGKAVLPDGLIIDSRLTEPIVIEIGARAAEVSGVVKDSNGGKVLLAPAELDEKTALYKVGSVGADGTFRIRGIRPGSYKLYAFRALDDDAWLAASFRDRMKTSGKAVDLKDGSKVETELAIGGSGVSSCEAAAR
jgi:hypothetical protein